MIVESRKEPYTLQELFNNAWQHAVVEKQPQARIKDCGCCYRLEEDGKMKACLIGISIPNELYNSSIEGKSISQIVQRKETVAKLFRLIPVEQLNSLQLCHDSITRFHGCSNYHPMVETKLREFATISGLSIP